MKRVTLALLLLFSITTIAQNGINYKALIKDGAGVIVASTPIDVTFIILDGAVNVYEETHAPTTDANGIVILNIGEGALVSGDFSTLEWSSNAHFLNVQIDTGGGLQDMGITAFKSVPYAMQAKTATTATTATALTGGIDQAYIAALEARIAALEPQPVSIGDIREGGVVFWVDSTGLHGLVCAMSDYATTVEWGCSDVLPSKSKHLITGSNDGKVGIWDVDSGFIVDGVGHGTGPNCVVAGRERKGRVFVCDVGKDIHVYDFF